MLIDNLDLISDADLMEELNQVLDDVPDGLQVVIASRNSGGLQVDQRMMRENFLYISQQELSFTSHEAGSFLKSALRFELEDRTLSKITELCEGWPGVLFRTSNMVNSDPHILSRYTAEAILSTASEDTFEMLYSELSEDLQSFLLYSSQLRHFSSELYEYVFKCTGARPLIRQLIRNNSFIVESTTRGQWFRYSFLFQSYLDQKWRETGESIENSLSIAASWCYLSGHYNEAVDYLLLAQQYEEALMQVVELSKSTLRTSGDTTRVVDWVEKLPLEFQHRYASLLLDYTLIWRRYWTDCRQTERFSPLNKVRSVPQRALAISCRNGPMRQNCPIALPMA